MLSTLGRHRTFVIFRVMGSPLLLWILDFVDKDADSAAAPLDTNALRNRGGVDISKAGFVRGKPAEVLQFLVLGVTIEPAVVLADRVRFQVIASGIKPIPKSVDRHRRLPSQPLPLKF